MRNVIDWAKRNCRGFSSGEYLPILFFVVVVPAANT